MLTSHYMQDIEALCKRVIVIDGGKIIFDGALEDVTERFGGSGRILTLEFSGRDGSRGLRRVGRG